MHFPEDCNAKVSRILEDSLSGHGWVTQIRSLYFEACMLAMDLPHMETPNTFSMVAEGKGCKKLPLKAHLVFLSRLERGWALSVTIFKQLRRGNHSKAFLLQRVVQGSLDYLSFD